MKQEQTKVLKIFEIIDPNGICVSLSVDKQKTMEFLSDMLDHFEQTEFIFSTRFMSLDDFRRAVEEMRKAFTQEPEQQHVTVSDEMHCNVIDFANAKKQLTNKSLNT